MYYCTYSSPIGQILLTADGHALTGLWLDSENPSLENARFEELPLFRSVKLWLDSYFRGEPMPITFPLAPRGTPFQMRVWQMLLSIPFGETTSYGAIAKKISPTMSAQAVGQAVGKNPVSIIIPCHRVIGSNGKLTGYAGGIPKKQWLLHHEEEHR